MLYRGDSAAHRGLQKTPRSQKASAYCPPPTHLTPCSTTSACEWVCAVGCGPAPSSSTTSTCEWVQARTLALARAPLPDNPKEKKSGNFPDFTDCQRVFFYSLCISSCLAHFPCLDPFFGRLFPESRCLPCFPQKTVFPPRHSSRRCATRQTVAPYGVVEELFVLLIEGGVPSEEFQVFRTPVDHRAFAAVEAPCGHPPPGVVTPVVPNFAPQWVFQTLKYIHRHFLRGTHNFTSLVTHLHPIFIQSSSNLRPIFVQPDIPFFD